MIRFQKPTIRRKDMNSVLQTLVDEKIGPGERKREFNTLFMQLVSKKYGCMLRTRGDAIKLALRAVGIKEGGTVGMSVLSPRIYGAFCKEMGLKILLGDIDPSTGCLSIEEAQRMQGEGANGILLHEPMGMFPQQDGFSELSIPLIEDITESLGSVYGEKKPGKIGKVAICGFEEQDMISTAGGCALVSNEKECKDNWNSVMEGIRDYVELPDMNAALGIIQLMTLDEQIQKRRGFYRLFQKNLMKTHHKVFGISNLEYEVNGYGFAVQLDSKIEEVMAFATKYQVSSKRTFEGCVGSSKTDDFDHFPSAIPAMLRCLSFPLYPFISQQDSDMLVKVISHLP